MRFDPHFLREMQNVRNIGVLQILFQAAIIGGGTGAVIGCFRLLYDTLSAFLTHLLLHPIILLSPLESAGILFAVLILLALLVSWITKYEPLISGSGIPQVELVLAGRSSMPWRRIIPAKFFGTLLALAGGLSVGREGPCVQMGAAVGCGVGEWLHKSPKATLRCLVGGAVAGLTAAFGAPIAGLFFAFEEMKVFISMPLLLFTGATAATAWFLVDILFAFDFVYPFYGIPPLDWQHLWIALLVGLGTGLLGAFYNLVQIKTALLYDRQRFLPFMIKNLPAFLLAGILFFVFPQVLNGIGLSMQQIAEKASLHSSDWSPCMFLVILLAVKLTFSILSFASGVPGGLLMPMLAVGGMSGSVVAFAAVHLGFLSVQEIPAVLTIGMAGLFAGTVRAPLTGIALVAEMSGAYFAIPGMILAALISSFTANMLRSAPVYDSLKKRLDANLQKKEISQKQKDTPHLKAKKHSSIKARKRKSHLPAKRNKKRQILFV